MSQTYISALVILITTIASLFNVKIVSEDITKIIEAVLILGSGLWILYRRYKQGDITIVGTRK
jgi:hypothetical protein